MMIFPTKIFHLALFSLAFLLTGCSAQRHKINDSSARVTQSGQTQFNAPPSPDHLLGQIIQGPKQKKPLALSNNEDSSLVEDGACQWLLQIDNDPSRLLDPVNLAEDFQKDGLQVWVLFSGMRRMNRCPEASPVWIQDIVLR